MPVTLYTPPASGLTQAEIARWARVPVAVAVDLGRDAGQIDPAIRPLRPAGTQPRLFGQAVTVRISGETDRDGEGLGGTGVLPAICRPAVIMKLNGNDCAASRVGSGQVRQVTARVDHRLR